MPPNSMQAARHASTALMTQTAQVVAQDSVSGRYTTTVLFKAMPCRLVHPTDTAPSSSGQRAELLADRDIWWPAKYDLPEQCRFVIDGVNWQPRAGTFTVIGDGTTAVARRAAVVRQQSAAFTS